VNRSDLIARMTERLGGDRAAAAAAVSGVLEEIETAVARGERVTLTGFGTFDRRARAARTARNPRTGDAVRVDASVVPFFRPAAGFKGLLHLPDGASDPASVTGDAQEGTGTRLQVVALPSLDTGVPAAVPTADGKKKKGRKAKQAAEKDSKVAKADKKARKAAKGKAGKKSA
jgi:DNA-binding protein HU-beta